MFIVDPVVLEVRILDFSTGDYIRAQSIDHVVKSYSVQLLLHSSQAVFHQMRAKSVFDCIYRCGPDGRIRQTTGEINLSYHVKTGRLYFLVFGKLVRKRSTVSDSGRTRVDCEDEMELPLSLYGLTLLIFSKDTSVPLLE